jgi:nucleotide-binding universal stress UspA family protein
MSAVEQPAIVVGVSGSPASVRALRWAFDEAQRLQARLRITLIWNIEQRAFYAPAISADDYERRQESAAARLAATVRAVLGSFPQDSVITEIAQGLPERAMVERSSGADLLVLGSASGLVSGRAIGPVIRACLSNAHCPVVVVGPEGSGSRGGHGPADPQRASITTLDRSDRPLAAAAAGPVVSAADGRPR